MDPDFPIGALRSTFTRISTQHGASSVPPVMCWWNRSQELLQPYLTYRKLTGADTHVSVYSNVTRTGYLKDAHIGMLQHSGKRANVPPGP
jgi:hypothetical protein